MPRKSPTRKIGPRLGSELELELELRLELELGLGGNFPRTIKNSCQEINFAKNM